jgi:PPOX class probable F420-dependent enzyme
MTMTRHSLADERFVSLTTFRTSGEPVSTPVWIAAHGDALVVTTPAGSGKVKRLRTNPKVQLRPCDRRGRVDESAPAVTGVAKVIIDPATVTQLTTPIRKKYGLEYKLIMTIERLIQRGRPRDRHILLITPA